jgi:asparagine synthase (glutamine-hydrolysing)
MVHRGPDDRGTYFDSLHKVALGHQRLAIIDVSHAGHQPMFNHDESIWLVFNGEIYNYKKLQAQLEQLGHRFNSSSDTEVIVRGYEAWGSAIFEKIDGMWALALYDKNKQKVFLSRDPAGIKPLYFFRSKGKFLFGSEIQALVNVLPKGELSVREESLHRFLVHGYIYGDHTAYQEISRIPPGSAFSYDVSTETLERIYAYSPCRRFKVSNLNDASERFEELFSVSVQSALQSDVPVGLFLSGGIDSALVGQCIKESGSKMQAFTVGFEEHSFDESKIASKIASYLDFPHHMYMMRGSDVAQDVLSILDSFGEPFADVSALPTYYLSKGARESGIKVALAGDGADELFGGYPTHYLPQITKHYALTPSATDVLLRSAATLAPSGFTKLGNREKILRFLHAAREPYATAHGKWKHVFSETDLQGLLEESSYEKLTAGDASFDDFFAAVRAASDSPSDEVMKVDFQTFMSGSCLVKSDISSMQHGLEVRVPFLNKDIIDFAWFLPSSLKVSPFATKKILRRTLDKHLPREIVRMKKRGFVPPLAVWLGHELKGIMTDLLSETNVARVGFLQYGHIMRLMEEHLCGGADHTKKIWALMSLVRFYTR